VVAPDCGEQQVKPATTVRVVRRFFVCPTRDSVEGGTPMSTEENKALVRRFYEEWNKQNLSIVEELVAPHWVCHGTLPGFSPDRAGGKQMLTALWTAFPDARIAVEDLIAEGDKVVFRYTFRATHQGEFMGVPATGKAVTLTGIYISRFAGGKVVEDWSSSDQLGLLQQLGVIPQMAQGRA
jgi:steroid delta-isomerase-like uncharacterized protein